MGTLTSTSPGTAWAQVVVVLLSVQCLDPSPTVLAFLTVQGAGKTQEEDCPHAQVGKMRPRPKVLS